MLVFESQTPQDLLKEIAEWLRMRALRANYVPAKTKKLREMDDAFHAALQTAAMELDNATVKPYQVDLNAAALRLYKRPYAELDADLQADVREESEDWGPNGPATCDIFE